MAYYYPQNPYLYPIQQPIQQPVQQQNGIIWVSGDAEAEAYPIAPNNAVRLWHSSQPIVYFKTADASGRPTLKAYDLVERAQSVSDSSFTQQGKVMDYATKSDLAALSQAIDTLKGEVKAVRKEIDKKKVDNDDE